MKTLAIAFICSVCASFAAAEVTAVVTENNLAVTNDLACMPQADIKAGYTTADLMVAVVDCAKTGRFQDSAALYLVAMSRGAFDSRRVADTTAHQAVQMLTLKASEALTDQERNALVVEIKKYQQQETPQHQVFCAALVADGPPDYYPEYMVGHGMNAVMGLPGDGLVEGFEPVSAWQDVVSVFMQCGPAE